MHVAAFSMIARGGRGAGMAYPLFIFATVALSAVRVIAHNPRRWYSRAARLRRHSVADVLCAIRRGRFVLSRTGRRVPAGSPSPAAPRISGPSGAGDDDLLAATSAFEQSHRTVGPIIHEPLRRWLIDDL